MFRLLWISVVLVPCACFAVQRYHKVVVGSFTQSYPVKPVPNSNLAYVYLYDVVDNLGLMEASIDLLHARLKEKGLLASLDGIVVPGDKANVFAALLIKKLKADHPNLFFYVMRGSAKGGSAHVIHYRPITSAQDKMLHLRDDQASSLRGRRVLVVDDVISTGETLKASMHLVQKAGGQVAGFAVLATEGVDRPSDFEGIPLVKVIHLPLYQQEAS
jgi:adenine/guanine phosphoribosyltransferase-like PRPP-binding protein